MSRSTDILAMQLSAPKEGYLVWFQTEPYGMNTWFHKWYGSLARAKAAATKMKIVHPIIVGYDHSVH